MPLAQTDFKIYLPVNRPIADADALAGAIQDEAHADGSMLADFADISATGVVEILSDGADARGWSITGRKSTGELVTETGSLNGTTVVQPTNSFERIEEFFLDAKSATRTVTLRKGSDDVTIRTIGINERGFARLFRNAVSEASQVDRYELVYVRNNHASLAALTASLKLASDASGKLAVGIAAAKGAITAVTGGTPRRTAPGGITFVAVNTAMNVPINGNLAPTEFIGIWIRQRLAANDNPFKAAAQITIDWANAA